MPQKIFTSPFHPQLVFWCGSFITNISYLTADTMHKPKGKLGVALINPGSYASYELAPAAANKKLLPRRNSDRNAWQRAGVG
jgi:hypothetical protein